MITLWNMTFYYVCWTNNAWFKYNYEYDNYSSSFLKKYAFFIRRNRNIQEIFKK